jgi:hypothetical protein
MPHQPVRWEKDRQSLLPGMTGARTAEVAKEAEIMQMINGANRLPATRGAIAAALTGLNISELRRPRQERRRPLSLSAHRA